MPDIRGSHLALWVVAAVLVVLFLLAGAADGILVVLLATVGAHFLLNVLFSVRGRRRPRDIPGGRLPEGYQDSSPGVLEEVFAQEGLGDGLELPVRVEGEVGITSAEVSPWSGKACAGWSLNVELYRKTALGGDSDYSQLVSRCRFSELEIRSAGRKLLVTPPGLLRGGKRAEALLSWKALDEALALRDIVDNEMRVRKLERKRYTGVRVAESVLEPGEKACVYGRATRDARGIVIRGSDTLGAPDVVMLRSGVPAPAAPRKRSGALRLAASLVFWAAGWTAAALLLRHVEWWRLEKAYPWANVERVGTLHWKGQGPGITVALSTLNLSSPSSWTMDPDDLDVDLVSGDQDALVRGATELTLTRPRLGPFSVLPGSSAYPRWEEGRFAVSLPDHSASPEGISLHEGSLHVINRSGGDLEIRFSPAAGRDELVGESWTLEPATGSVLVTGTRLVLDDQPFSLTEGDGILLRRPGASSAREAFITVGGNPAVMWDEAGKRWLLIVVALWLEPRAGSIELRNPNGFPVKVEITDRAGESSLGTWTLEAGFGGATGAVLSSGGRPFEFREGEVVHVEPQAVEALYSGPISAYPSATWAAGMWTIGP